MINIYTFIQGRKIWIARIAVTELQNWQARHPEHIAV